MRLRLHVEITRDRKKAVEHLPDRQFANGFAARWLTDRTQRSREFVDIVIAWHILRLEMDFGDALIIAGCQAIENFRQPETRLPVDAAHDAKIYGNNRAVDADEQIALMHIGMEKAFRNRLPQKC